MRLALKKSLARIAVITEKDTMKRTICLLGVLLLLVGCTNFATTVFRLEQTAANGAVTAYVGWTNHLATGTVSVQASNEVKQARLHFGATLSVVDGLRVAYETNSLVKPQLQAALDTLNNESSNVVWLIQYWKGSK